jgi:hypothetical protein
MTTSDKLTLALVAYLDNNRNAGLPAASLFPIRAASHDSPQDVPGCVVMAGEAEEMVPMRETYRVDATVRLRAEAKVTTATTLRDYAGYITEKLADRAALRTYANKPVGTDNRAVQAFHLYDLFVRDGRTMPEGDDFVTEIDVSAVCTGHDIA